LIFKKKEAKNKSDAEKLQNRLHKVKNSAKGILTLMPKLATNFQILQIQDDLKLLLLQVYLTEDARK